MDSFEENKKSIGSIMEEFIDACDEYLFCLVFSVQGIEQRGKELKKMRFREGQRLWIGSDLETNKKMHARMDLKELIKRCSKNGRFTTELTKSLLCLIYAMWDESFRHRIAAAYGCEPEEVFCPLMGDLRKIRHCIIHHKSIVHEKGIQFEYLDWKLASGPLSITYEMFREFNDAVRGRGMKIHAEILCSEIKFVLPLMSSKERNSFYEFYKNPDNKVSDNRWPGMNNFIRKNEGKPGVQELKEFLGIK